MRWIGGLSAALLLGACSSPTTQGVPSGTPSNSPTSPAVTGKATAALEPTIQPGQIAGTLLYPGDKHPEIIVYAIRTDGGRPSTFTYHVWARDVPMAGGEPFGMTVVPGTYHLVAYTVAGSSGPHVGAMGGVNGCMGNANCQPTWFLSTVTVGSAQLVNQVEISDWNPPIDQVPSEPRLVQYATIPPRAWPTSDIPPFSTPADAAIYGIGRTRYRSERAGCSVVDPGMPPACLLFESIKLGTDAAYIRALFGDVQNLSPTWIYLFHDAAGWHFLDSVPEPATGQGSPPRPGQQDTIQTSYEGGGCATARIRPGIHQQATACLRAGTAVSIDDGPVYIDEVRAADGVHEGLLWWHLAGKGWVPHEFLMPQLIGD